MPVRSRVMIVSAACCVLTAVSLPAAALAHGGRGHRGHGHARFANRVQRLCAQAGAPLNGHSHGDAHGPSGLTETQIKELKVACEKLASASAAERKADQAASTALENARKAARSKLDEACPMLAEGHRTGTELTAACKEALKSYRSALREARKADRKALDEAAKPFETALAEFDAAVKPIVTALEGTATGHHHHYYRH